MSDSDNHHQSRKDPSARPKMISILKKTINTSSNFSGSGQNLAPVKTNQPVRPKMISILKKKTSITTNNSSISSKPYWLAGKNMAASNMKSITPGGAMGWVTTSIPVPDSGGFSGAIKTSAIISQPQVDGSDTGAGIAGVFKTSNNNQTGDLTDLQYAGTRSGHNLLEPATNQGSTEVGLGPSKTESWLELIESIEMKTEKFEEEEEGNPQPDLQSSGACSIKEEQTDFSEVIKKEQTDFSEVNSEREEGSSFMLELLENIKTEEPEDGGGFLPEMEEGDLADGGRKLFGCKFCSETFSSSQLLWNHLCQCPECNKTMKYRGVTRHIQAVHLGERPHHCPHCSQAFSRSSELKTHIQAVHLGLKHRCPHCHKVFCRSSDLTRHIKNKHLQ